MTAELSFDKVICEPPLPEWEKAIRTNHAALQHASGLASLRQHIRPRIFSAAEEYTRRLEAQASVRGVPFSFSDDAAAEEQEQFVMAGHQPGMYHLGVLNKYLTLTAFKSGGGVSKFNVIVDTDEGDAGQFLVPLRKAGGLSVERFSIADRAGLFFFQRVAEAARVEEVFRKAAAALGALQDGEPNSGLSAAAAFYTQLAGLPLRDASAIVRRAFEPNPDYRELPLSTVVTFPEARHFFGQLLAQPERFHSSYNQTLRAFRRRRGIKNPANPFPDLTRSEDRMEVPFWVIDSSAQKRERLFLRLGISHVDFFAGNEQIATCEGSAIENYSEALGARFLLAPRALLITLFLRLACCDFFVHGLGGKRYDACTDDFIRDYFQLEPPSFATVSATKYLFPEELKCYERKEALARARREAAYHLEKFIKEGFFTLPAAEELRKLAQEKQALVTQLKSAQEERRSAADIGKRIKRIDQEVRRIVDEDVAKQSVEGICLSDAERSVIENREYPYFLFLEPPREESKRDL